ncbi:hypothetical protein ACGFZS_00795 [Streptomyces sp. NPDC048288]|uniref:hypothetical protein n=1 Tax=Streptomyces sp. NPDC048288 TaxID=3365529 RepID=UPI00371133BA
MIKGGRSESPSGSPCSWWCCRYACSGTRAPPPRGSRGRYVLVPAARFLWRHVLAPTGHAIGWILHRLLVLPLIWLYRHLLTPLGHALLWLLTPVARVFDRLATALAWTARVLLVLPARALWRWILTPVGRVLGIVLRETGDALGHAWRAAGYVARAAGRVLATLFRWIFQEPARWVYRTVLSPVGHVVRDLVLRPAAQAARAVGRAVGQARADLRRALFGESVPPTAVHRREPVGRDARTLDG